jgi:hypothetical protein
MHEGHSVEPFAQALAIERSWYLTGPVDPEQHVGLEARFHRALGAFHTDAP